MRVVLSLSSVSSDSTSKTTPQSQNNLRAATSLGRPIIVRAGRKPAAVVEASSLAPVAFQAPLPLRSKPAEGHNRLLPKNKCNR
jgi:hypothetical protein